MCSSTPPPPTQAQAGHQAPQEQEHHAPPAQQEQQLVHLNWSHFAAKISGNLMRMQRPICFALMTG